MMTNEDGSAAIELVTEEMSRTQGKLAKTQDKLRGQWGRGVKRTEREQYALVFANSFNSVGGIFEFTQAHRDFGYTTIWEAMAGECHEPAAKPMQKAENVEQYAHVYKSGCSQLAEMLRLHWDDVVIYSVPRTVNGLLIEVITIDPDHVVNREGQTAYEVWERREIKRVGGQIKSAAVKLTRATSPAQALEYIARVTSPEMLQEAVRVPSGSLEQQ